MRGDEATCTIRPATERDVDELCEVLARAFYADPVMAWIMRDERFRTLRLSGMFAMTLRGLHLAGGGTEVALRGDRIMAGAIWDPPGRLKQPTNGNRLRELRAIMRVFGWRVGSLLRSNQMMQAVEQHRPRTPHWYLAQIGTDPTAGGQGFGRALMVSRLERCDRDGLPAYLESSAKGNIPLYERFGFRVTGEITLPNGPALWSMWRDPA